MAVRVGYGHGIMPLPGGGSSGPFDVDLPLVTGTGLALAHSVSLGGGAGGYPNEPAGMTQVAFRNMNAQPEDGWSNTDANNLSIVSSGYVGTPEFDPAAVLRSRFPAGPGNGSAKSNVTTKVGLDTIASIDRPQEFYFAFELQPSGNFQGHGSNTNKLWFLKPGMGHGSGSNAFINCFGSGAGNLNLRANLQGSNSSVCGQQTTRILTANISGAAITRDQWDKWEIYGRLNAKGPGETCDGIFRCWKNGALTHEYTDVHWLDDAVPAGSWGWDRLEWRPIWGGTNETINNEMYYYLSNVKCSLKTAFA